MMPTKVKIDISHDADPASMPMFVMMSPMTTGTLNWIVAIAAPNRSMATAISAQFPYLFSVFLVLPSVSMGRGRGLRVGRESCSKAQQPKTRPSGV